MYPSQPGTESAVRPPAAGGLATPLDSSLFISSRKSTSYDPRTPVLAMVPVAGSLGVRGLIDGVAGGSLEETTAELRGALEVLRSDGVQRAHIFIPQGSPLGEVAAGVGFGTRLGERLYVCPIEACPATERLMSGAVVMRDGTVDDLVRVGLTLAEVPELAFAPWEMPLIARGIGREGRIFKVVAVDGVVVGVVIGGTLANVGTISHLWVDRNHRHLQLGSALCDEAMESLKRNGAQSVYLMTTEGNHGANRFWERQGFRWRDDAFFMEIDL